MNRFPVASLGLVQVNDLSLSSDVIQRHRYGEISVFRGQFRSIHFRWWPRLASHWDIVRDTYIRSISIDECKTYYAFPMRSPGFMAINYVRSGKRTQYETIRKSMEVVDRIAALRNANAIVCQVTNARITDRMMHRWGFVKHASSLGDNHYIKRFNR